MDNDADDATEPGFQTFAGVRRPSNFEAVFSHKTWAFRRISKRFGLYVECGVSRLPLCPNCGAHPTGDAKVYLDRLPLGGFAGGLLMRYHSNTPPQLKPEYPGQAAFDEREILPES
jgi:hypothetical protein